ncbi:MAG: ribonuclease HII [Parcubacteria group bacterium Gr01-1014_38]|nr:MAG: ribonuclease HII [Parcubacteria group bacterium Gr01-1014_38]
MSPLRTTYRFERTLWNRGFRLVAGVDEVGMGCLAGPVVAAAVILPVEIRIDFVRDSKTLTEPQRVRLAEHIQRSAITWAVGDASPREIATLNLHWAAVEAMRRALAALRPPPDAVLTDAYQIPDLPWYHEAVIKGDRKVRSIAAASIVAKVHRDALMTELDQQYPGYGFAGHKGYGTPAHQRALKKLGPTPIHRPSFKPVQAVVSRQ